MKISVISPSYNQVQFLPDNLHSVASQKGVEVEHILIDPGSTDGSLQMARAASNVVLIAEPDRGQSHGITKGFQACTGDVMVWLNSDDFYPSNNTLKKVADAFAANPDADIIYGGVNFVDENGKFLRAGFVNNKPETLLESFQYQVGIVQPAVFMRRRVFEKLGGPSEDYEYCMDYEYWVRMADAQFKWVYIDEVLAHHRWWDGMKTASGRDDSLVEHFRVCTKYFGYIHHKWLDRYGEFLATDNDGVVNHADKVVQAEKDQHVRAAIETYVTQDMLTLLESSSEPNHKKTLAYIRRIAPGTKRVLFAADELPKLEMSHPDPLAKERTAWCIFDSKQPKRAKTYKSYIVPDNFARHFDAKWYQEQTDHAQKHLMELQNRRKETCVIVANGPSLNKSNLELLDRADVIVSNFAIVNDTLRRNATYFTTVNDLVACQGATIFNQLDVTKVIPFWLGNSINSSKNTAFVPATVNPEFCTTIDGEFSWRSTVSYFNMQLAFTMGYEKVLLIGFDHSYQQRAGVKEGDLITQDGEDLNHFDPRYFQGKDWQAADTDNMELMYERAKIVYDKAGRSIVNATVGGKLEVFERGILEDTLGTMDPGTARLPSPSGSFNQSAGTLKPPRLLILDMTAMGNGTATGEIKSNLFREWPREHLLQVASPTPKDLSLVRRDAEGGYSEVRCGAADIQPAITRFDPEMILYRPLPDRPELHALAMSIIENLDLPLVTWVMDDWPARASVENPAAFQKIDPDFKALLKRSVLRLSISDAMTKAYEKRYNLPFTAFANGVDLAAWPNPKTHSKGPLVLRYAGGMAPDMNAKSIQRVAKAVQELADKGQDIRFEINTQPWWLEKSGKLFDGLTATTVTSQNRSFAEYAAWLSDADALLIAYNFDENSLRYVRYSMANKLPEYLGSGVPILVHGPRDVATIDYVMKHHAAQVVEVEQITALKGALKNLTDPSLRQKLADTGRTLAQARHDLPTLARDLALLFKAACPVESAARFGLYLVGDGGGILPENQDLADAGQALSDGGSGVLVYPDPLSVIAVAMEKGSDGQDALKDWQLKANAQLVLFRKMRDKLKIVEDSHAAPASVRAVAPEILGQDLREDNPLFHALASLLFYKDPKAVRILAEMRSSGVAPSKEYGNIDITAAVTHAHNRTSGTARALPVGSTEWLQEQATQLQTIGENHDAEQMRRSGAGGNDVGSRYLQAQVDVLQLEIEGYYNSKSHRVTAPMRALRRWVGPKGTGQARQFQITGENQHDAEQMRRGGADGNGVGNSYLQAQVDALQLEIEHIYNSNSYRITKPMRAFRRWVGTKGAR